MGFHHISNKWGKLYNHAKGVPGGGGNAIQWLLRDEFTTAASAPLPSPRVAEPGPGTWTVIDTNNRLSIASGKLVSSAHGDNTLSNALLISGGFARSAGLALFFTHNNGSVGSVVTVVGWTSNPSALDTAGNIRTSWLADSSMDIAVSNIVTANTEDPSTSYQYCIVLKSIGSWFFVKGGSFASWSLLWSDPIINASTLYAAANFYRTTGQGGDESYDTIKVRQLSAPFTVTNGIATVDQTTAVSDTSYTATADAIHDLTVTAPNPLANSAELRYRVTDDTNYWTAYLNNAGAFRVDSVASGSATNRVNVSSVAGVGNTYTIRVIAVGTKHNFYTLVTTNWTKRGSEIDLSHQDSSVAVKPVAGTGWVLGALRSFPRTSSVYAQLDRT